MILNEQLLHGCDYNPDQWLDRPDILEKDITLMKEARINCVSLAIFAWVRLEPEDGIYDFEWLIQIVDNLYKNDIYTIMATPSGARPAWLAEKYPEVLRVDSRQQRNRMGARHNHCPTSPSYRKKVWDMNYRLAQTFKDHPGVILWHLSNEYNGTCYCPLCQEEFRNWVKDRYQTLDAVNKAWWMPFWSHNYTSWSQIEPPYPNGESSTHGLNLAWRRFSTDRCIDFCQNEKDAIRAAGSDLPVTTNLMELFYDYNYFKLQKILDLVCWDSYPDWHIRENEIETAVHTAFAHDLIRSLKRKPFLLMESTPSTLNWKSVSKLKKPQMHMLSSMQAVAHGSDSVQYFQWRKSRGASEKFHGAVVDHYGKSDTRVFKDVANLGERLQNISFLSGSLIRPKVAIFFDWENRWAVDDAAGPRNTGIHYTETIQSHYQAFWKMGIPVDFIDMESDLSDYKLIIAPMLYMYRNGIQTKLREFVQNGGTLAGTYWSGIVDEDDLTYLEGAPNGMMDVYGLREEEIDGLYDHESNSMTWSGKKYILTELCARPILQGAEPLAVYESDFYQGEPVLTRNGFGKGYAYYLAARAEDSFYLDFYRRITSNLQIKSAMPCSQLPDGVTAGIRLSDDNAFIILQNYSRQEQEIQIEHTLKDLENGEVFTDSLYIMPWDVKILQKV